MGNFFAKLWASFGTQHARILMVGLDGAGKTTILYKLKLGEVVSTVPTIGFNVERVQHERLEMDVWDIGGQEKIRPLWRHYFQGSDAIIFVVDSLDHERLDSKSDNAYERSACEELQSMMQQDELRDAAVLVFANKQDLPGALNVAKVAERLQLPQMKRREWHIQACCATTGDGLIEGMSWLSETLKNRPTAN